MKLKHSTETQYLQADPILKDILEKLNEIQTAVTDLYNSGTGLTYPFEKYCTFNGTVKDGDGTAIDGAKIVIANLEDDTLYLNTTSDANGLWNVDVSVDGNYTVYAYQPNNITRAGDIFPYVECIR